MEEAEPEEETEPEEDSRSFSRNSSHDEQNPHHFYERMPNQDRNIPRAIYVSDPRRPLAYPRPETFALQEGQEHLGQARPSFENEPMFSLEVDDLSYVQNVPVVGASLAQNALRPSSHRPITQPQDWNSSSNPDHDDLQSQHRSTDGYNIPFSQTRSNVPVALVCNRPTTAVQPSGPLPRVANYEELMDKSVQSFQNVVCSERENLIRQLLIYVSVDEIVRCQLCRHLSGISADQHHKPDCEINTVNVPFSANEDYTQMHLTRDVAYNESRAEQPKFQEGNVSMPPQFVSSNTSLYLTATPEVAQEPTLPQGTQEPTVTQGTQEATVPRCTQEPTVPQGTQVPTVPRGTQEPTVTRDAQEPTVTQEPTVPQGTQEPAVPRGTQEPTVPRGSQETFVPGPQEQADVGMPSDSDGALAAAFRPLLPPVLHTSKSMTEGASKQATKPKSVSSSMFADILKMCQDMGIEERAVNKALSTEHGKNMMRTDPNGFVMLALEQGSAGSLPADPNLCFICEQRNNSVRLFYCGCHVCSDCAPKQLPASCGICSARVEKISSFTPNLRKK